MELHIIDMSQPTVRLNTAITRDFLFAAILNRFTGRQGVFSAHRRLFPDRQLYSLPRISELASFLEFVEINEGLPKLFSPQHVDQIPKDIQQNIVVFKGFTRDVANGCQGLASQLQQFSNNRLDAVNCMVDYLMDAFRKNRTYMLDRDNTILRKRFRFLSHQIIADIEEVYDNPYGEVSAESVMYGPGSTYGRRVCVGESLSDDDYYSGVLRHLEGDGDSSQSFRKMLGCLLTEDGRVVVGLNLRPLCLTDLEHWFCKVYIGAAKTLPGRSDTIHPASSKPGHHPTLVNQLHPLREEGFLSMLLAQVVDEYCQRKTRLQIRYTPERFLLCGERDPLL
jgi:hypothetical protein